MKLHDVRRFLFLPKSVQFYVDTAKVLILSSKEVNKGYMILKAADSHI